MRTDIAARLDDFAQEIARGAGAIIKASFRASFTWRSKDGGKDIVTEVDERSEAYVIERVRRELPGARILSEEAGILGPDDAEITWIVDPLDGTRNYAAGIPFFCVSIGVLVNGQPEVGAIYDPIHDEMFFARRGQGAFCNGESIRVSDEKSMDDGLISVSWVRRKTDRGQFVGYMDEISRRTSYFRRFGSAALAMSYVACGRTLAYLQGGLSPWDVAAGLVMIEEAGGLATDFKGGPISSFDPQIEIVTANPDVHAALLREIIKAPVQ